MPVFMAKYDEHREELEGTYSAELLGTIRVPKNLSLLANLMPKAQYSEDKRPEPQPVDEEPVIKQNDLESLKRIMAPLRQSEAVASSIPNQGRPAPLKGVKAGEGNYHYNQRMMRDVSEPPSAARLVSYENGQSHADLLISKQYSNQ